MACQERNSTLNTEISQLPALIDQLENSNLKNSLLKINHLILNPFPIQLILSNDQFISLIKYNLKYTEEKIAIKNLAILLNNVFISKKSFELSPNNIFGLEVSNLNFWKIYCQFSKMNYFLFDFKIDKKDSFLVQKLKIKTISYLAIKSDLMDGLKKIEPFLEEVNVQISWAISKAMYRIIRCTKNPDEILNSYLYNIELRGVGFWINLTNVFTLFLTEKKFYKFEFYRKMLFYDREYKSNLVREAALFHVYIYCRNNLEIELENIILIALFDHNVLCRKAAYSIILEYFSTKEIANKNQILEQINNFTLNKVKNSLIILTRMLPNLNIKTHLIQMLSSYNQETRNLAVNNLKSFFNCTKELGNQKNLFFLNSILNFILKIDICDYELKLINTIVLTEQLANSKLFSEFVLNYLKCAIKVETKQLSLLTKNMQFLVEKNFVCEEIAFVYQKIFEFDQNIGIEMFNLLNKKRNDCILLVNTFNTKFIGEIQSIFRKRFNCVIIKCATLQIKSKISVEFELIKLILDNLENYSVDYTGDTGMKMRLEALKFTYFYDKNLFLDYFFRYFVDKSKFLRDFLIYNVFTDKSTVYFLKHTDFPIHISCTAITEYKTLYIQNKELDLDNDIVHFKSAFSIFNYLTKTQQNEFMFGCFNSLKNSDRHLFDYLVLKLNEIYCVVCEYLDSVFNQKDVDRRFVVGLYGCYYLKLKESSLLQKIEKRILDFKSETLKKLALKILEE